MYKLRFTDDTEFIGGEPNESLWNQIPVGKSIASLQYSFLGVGFLFKGFEAYNHIVERVIVLNKNNPLSRCEEVSRAILLCKWQNRVYEVIYDLKAQKVFQQVELLEQDVLSSDSWPVLKITPAAIGWIKGQFDPAVHPKIRGF